MRARRSGSDWSYLRWLVESNLQRQPEFKKGLRLGRRLETLGQGMFNRNYLVEVSDEMLVLRLAKTEPRLRTKREAVISLRREAKTLQALERMEFPYPTPKFVCLVEDESEGTVGLIESALDGASFKLFLNRNDPQWFLESIANVAAAVHRLAKPEFTHLKDRVDSRAHVIEQLDDLSPDVFDRFEEAAKAREWIISHLPENRGSVILHGDLLPQNLLVEGFENPQISVIDWQEAMIGDPAYDLAVVTRGARQPLGIAHGLRRLVKLYNQAADQELTVEAVVVHELLFNLGWLADAVKSETQGHVGGHSPEHYAAQLGALLRRAMQREQTAE